MENEDLKLVESVKNLVDKLKNVEYNPERLGGMATVAGTRFPISRIFAELTDDQTLAEIAEDYDQDLEQIIDIFNELSLIFEDTRIKE